MSWEIFLFRPEQARIHELRHCKGESANLYELDEYLIIKEAISVYF